MGYMLLLLVETEKRGKQTHQEQRACDQGWQHSDTPRWKHPAQTL